MDPNASALSKSISKLGLEIFQETSPLKNLVLSPTSIINVMVMLHEGASGETRDEIAALFVGASESSFARQLGELLDELTHQRTLDDTRSWTMIDEGKPEFVISPANSIWIQEGYECRSAFKDLIHSELNGAVRTIDMIGTPHSAADEINEWVFEATRGRISVMISPDSLSGLSRLIVCNALYLKATWMRPFPWTFQGDFQLLDGSIVAAKMMRGGGRGKRYAVEGDLWAVEISYMNDDVVMIVIVPSDTGPDSLLALEKQLPTVLGRLDFKPMDKHDMFTIPEFSITSDLQIADYLRGSGVAKLFSQEAELSEVSGAKPLWVNAIIHGASIQVDRHGTEAAAVTMAVLFGALSPANTLQLEVDRPFIFVVLDKPTDTILFLGRVVDPRADDRSQLAHS